MKITAFLLLIACLHVQARGLSQKISLSEKNVPLTKIFAAIKEKSGYSVVYDNYLLANTRPVTVEVSNASVEEILTLALKGQSLGYAIEEKIIFIKKGNQLYTPEFAAPPPASQIVRGVVKNEKGSPVDGAAVVLKARGGRVQGTLTNSAGEFSFKDVATGSYTLEVNLIGYNVHTRSLEVTGTLPALSVSLTTATNVLDETVIQAYGVTSRRYSTSSIGKVDETEIAKQPVANVLQALQGRVPGLVISLTSGYASASVNVQVRGQNSIAFAGDPLFIIDGVQMMAGAGDSRNLGLNQNFMISGATQSPLFSINPADIASIEVLKDADATAIYGSQGANGVILVTTKRGKPGKTKLDLNVYTGAGSVTKLAKLLNTPDYLMIRKEAFKNDNVAPTLSTAPDLLKWDQNRYTDWQDYLLGNTAHTTDAQAGFSGGDEYTQYRVSGSFHRQTDVTTVSGADKRSSVSFNLSNASKDRKFRLNFSSSYSYATTNRINFDNSLITLPPNAPAPFDSMGNVNYKEWGYYNTGLFTLTASDPFGVLLQPYEVGTDNLQSSLQLQYQPISKLTLRVTGGYSLLQNNQLYITPKAAQDPTQNPISKTQFGNNSVKTWTIEPQAEYNTFIGRGRLTALAGSTFQSTITKGQNGTATDFSNEALLHSIAAAKTITLYSDTYVPYRYQAVFGRLNYVYNGKYLVNATARRDGSSRFGPGHQFGNFGAIGAGWIFSEENWMKDHVPVISFGKLRGSYGITGSANVGDYSFLSRWSPNNNLNYQGTATLSPTQHYNPEYGWEVNKKLELAIELGLLKDRIQLTTSWYRNRSGNQLVSMPLPAYTGFSSVTANLPALVQNMGWEFSATSINIKKKDISWNTSFNITIARNKLLSFPGLASSSYAQQYTIGQSLTMQRLLHYTGVNPQTGDYTFEDVVKDGKITTSGLSNDLVPVADKAPRYYGGLSNTAQYKNWQLSVFFQFTKQKGYLNRFSLAIPGSIYNQSDIVLQRWQKPGDITSVPKVSTIASNNYTYYNNSDAGLADASFARLQNLSIAYILPAGWVGKYGSSYTRIYLQAQNLLTITGYKGADPETQSLTSVPPVKFITAGLQITF